MAESNLIREQRGVGAVPVLHGWGILRLVRPWPSEQAAAGGHAARWPNEPAQPATARRDLALVPVEDPAFDRQATAMALRDVLARWRLAELDLDEAIEGSFEWSLLEARIASLRSSYHRLFAEVRGESRDR